MDIGDILRDTNCYYGFQFIADESDLSRDCSAWVDIIRQS